MRQSRILLIRISPAAASSALTAGARTTLSGRAALSLRLYFGARHQTQLPIGHYLLAGFQSVINDGHGIGYGADFNNSHLGGRIKLDDVDEQLVLANLDGL